MATFVMFCRYTEQGARNVKESPERMAGFRKILRNYGGEVKADYLLVGSEHDTLVLFDAPDDDAAAKAAIALSGLGNVRTETHRAYSEEDFRRLVKELK